MPHPRLDVPLVWPDAARFVWREAFLEALAAVPAVKPREHEIFQARFYGTHKPAAMDTVLQVLHNRCGPAYEKAFNALTGEYRKKHSSSLRDERRVWAWCCQELAGAEVTSCFLEDIHVALGLGPPAPGKPFVDRFLCAPTIRDAVEAVGAFLAEVRLAAPEWQRRPWWLLQVALATLLPGTEKGKWAWWREDFESQAIALENPPLRGRLIERVGDGRPLPGNYGIGKVVTTLEPTGEVLSVSSLEWAPATGHHEVRRNPGEREGFYARKVDAYQRHASKDEAARIKAGELVLDPRPGLDLRPFRWTVLARCAGKSFPDIAAEEAVTDEAVRQRVHEVKERVGLER